ncbi:helix-turn-helix transcriptional regulator [Microbispora amethystogenes]|uniref:helix-turn-helix domain-containing protein n=1 Tax=Microbispora amethystogenes TaxID=1427754 RepID=UPI0033D91C03
MAEADDYDWEVLGQAIHVRRRELSIPSQAVAAEQAGVHPNTWNRAERGLSIGDSSLHAIAEVLQWDPGTPLAILRGADPAAAGALRSGDTRTPPLAVIPLSTGLEISAAILGALADAWESTHDHTLRTGDMSTEPTPWGPAIVVRDPTAADDP